jgi:hypothetical protein
MTKRKKNNKPTESTGKKAKKEEEALMHPEDERKQSASTEDKASRSEGLTIDDGLMQYLNIQFGKIQEKMDAMQKDVGVLEEKMDAMQKDLKKDVGAMQKDVGLLISLSPEAVIQHIDPLIVGCDASNTRAVLEGGESTWSYLRSFDGKSLLAVGSLHCGLYYATVNPTCLRFVNLPQELIDRKVEAIGFCSPTQLLNPMPQMYNLMMVKLKEDIPYHPSQVHKYEAFTTKHKIHKIAGKSNSGIVSGSNVVSHEGHLVFVEDFGESGNSGTLMFGWRNDISEAKPIGVYYGAVGGHKDARSSVSNGLHPRGIVVPLPDPKEITWFEVEKDNFPRSLHIIDGKGERKCRLIHEESSHSAACLLEDGGKWPGVLLKFHNYAEKIKYCGYPDNGSRRCV